MTTRAHTRWQQATDAMQRGEPKAEMIDLAKPDAEAAALAEKLQAAHTHITFTRVIFYFGKWVIRPLFWLPIKYFLKIAIWAIANPNLEAEKQARRQHDYDRRREDAV